MNTSVEDTDDIVPLLFSIALCHLQFFLTINLQCFQVNDS